MRKITKRSGLEEEFSLDKIINSMRNAGISQETAKNVAVSIDHRKGITTSEVRNHIIGGIKNREPQAAMKFQAYPKKTHDK